MTQPRTATRSRKRLGATLLAGAGLAALFAASPASAGGTRFFQSPSHNIGCVIAKVNHSGGMRCHNLSTRHGFTLSRERAVTF